MITVEGIRVCNMTGTREQAAQRDFGVPEGLIRLARRDLSHSALLDAQSQITDLMARGLGFGQPAQFETVVNAIVASNEAEQ
jgi:hypothetical protein